MKIKRFLAADIRTALQQVKEALGPEAVILSNRKTDDGVEIVAALDFDLETVSSSKQSAVPSKPDHPAPAPTSKVTPKAAYSAKGYHAVAEIGRTQADATPSDKIRKPVFPKVTKRTRRTTQRNYRSLQEGERTATAAGAGGSGNPHVKPVSSPEADLIAPLRRELQQMRRLLDRHLSQTAWQEEIHKHPTRLDLLRALDGLGFSRALAMDLARRGGVEEEFDRAWRQLQEALVNQLPVLTDPLLDQGGIVALVGPTGVGKTTTIAKLAARFRLQHGPRQIALVTTDNYRIAAHEQLSTYARILGVPVRVANNADELHAILRSFMDKRLVLIDTAGMSHRDQRLAQQFTLFQESEIAIETYLVLSAAAQRQSLYEAMEAFAEFNPRAGILTKLDEAGCLGPALSALLERGLPLSFMTDGQKVPEDLHHASAEGLVARCFDADPQNTPAGEDGYEDWMGYASNSL